MIFRDDLVAGAVVADRVAERDVHVERERTLLEGTQRSDQVIGLKRFVETICGWIGGVARPELIVLPDQPGIEEHDWSQIGASTRMHGLESATARAGTALSEIKFGRAGPTPPEKRTLDALTGRNLNELRKLLLGERCRGELEGDRVLHDRIEPYDGVRIDGRFGKEPVASPLGGRHRYADKVRVCLQGRRVVGVHPVDCLA